MNWQSIDCQYIFEVVHLDVSRFILHVSWLINLRFCRLMHFCNTYTFPPLTTTGCSTHLTTLGVPLTNSTTQYSIYMPGELTPEACLSVYLYITYVYLYYCIMLLQLLLITTYITSCITSQLQEHPYTRVL